MENTNKTISLATLKAKPILKKIGEIEIYNINSKVNSERRKQLFDYITKVLETKKPDEPFESVGKDLILNLLPILTNILLAGLDDEEIEGILLEPSDELVEVVKIINKIITDILNDLNEVAKLPKEQIEKFIPKKSKKELLLEQWEQEEKKRKAELEAKLAEAEEDEENNNIVEVDFEDGGE